MARSGEPLHGPMVWSMSATAGGGKKYSTFMTGYVQFGAAGANPGDVMVFTGTSSRRVEKVTKGDSVVGGNAFSQDPSFKVYGIAMHTQTAYSFGYVVRAGITNVSKDTSAPIAEKRPLKLSGVAGAAIEAVTADYLTGKIFAFSMESASTTSAKVKSLVLPWRL